MHNASEISLPHVPGRDMFSRLNSVCPVITFATGFLLSSHVFIFFAFFFIYCPWALNRWLLIKTVEPFVNRAVGDEDIYLFSASLWKLALLLYSLLPLLANCWTFPVTTVISFWLVVGTGKTTNKWKFAVRLVVCVSSTVHFKWREKCRGGQFQRILGHRYLEQPPTHTKKTFKNAQQGNCKYCYNK